MRIITSFKNFWLVIRRGFKKTHIKVVHDDDLDGLLISLNLYDGINLGNYICFKCDNIITKDNLWGILRKDDKFHLLCSNDECISLLD